jgi:hypothetical protein
VTQKNFDVQSVGIARPAAAVFSFIAVPENLSIWTNAFKSADASSAVMETPGGSVTITLETTADAGTGIVDWKMTFPDGAVANAYSRITPNGDDEAVYSFVLMAPPVPLEMLEGALGAQKAILAEELLLLKAILEK